MATLRDKHREKQRSHAEAFDERGKTQAKEDARPKERGDLDAAL